MKFEEWLSQQDGVIEVDCGCVTTEAFYHWMRVAYEAGSSPVIPGAEQRIADAVELLKKAAPAMLADNVGPDGPLAGRMKSPVIPEGYVMVPKEMTDEIGEAIAMQANCCGGIALDIYDAMIAAAPHDTPALNSLQSVDSVTGGWIPVSERMPEVGDIVLTAMGGAVNVGEMECSAANCRFFTSVISGRELPATYWMPLPAAPQEAQGE